MSIFRFTPTNQIFYLIVGGCLAGAVLPLDLVITFGAIAVSGLGREIIEKLAGRWCDGLVTIWSVVILIGWYVAIEKLVSI